MGESDVVGKYNAACCPTCYVGDHYRGFNLQRRYKPLINIPPPMKTLRLMADHTEFVKSYGQAISWDVHVIDSASSGKVLFRTKADFMISFEDDPPLEHSEFRELVFETLFG